MILKTILLILMMFSLSQAATLPSATISLSARDVVWSASCIAAPVTTPFCREGAGATLATYCASGGTYAACVGAGGGTVDGTGATNKVAYWSDADTLTYDTLFHFDPVGNNIGLGTASFGTGLTQGIALTHDATNWPSTNITDTVQVYARDQAGSTNSSLFIKAEAGGITSIGDRITVGNGGILPSNPVAIGGIQLEGVGVLLQMGDAVNIAHGITAAIATSTFFDARPAVAGSGGIQLRGITESTIGTIVSGIVTTETTTKTTTSDAPIILEVGRKDSASIQAMSANSNLVVIQDRYAALPTKWLADNDGDTWQTGRASSLGIDLRGSTSGTVSFTPNSSTTSYTLTMPAAQGGASKVLSNDGTGVLSWVSVGGAGDALVANPLSQFASTTSAQLATVLSNETGTTLAVFSDAPTFTGIPLFSGGLKTTGTPTNAIEIASGSGSTKAIESLSSAPVLFTGHLRVGIDIDLGVFTMFNANNAFVSAMYAVKHSYVATSDVIAFFGETLAAHTTGTTGTVTGIQGRATQAEAGNVTTMAGLVGEVSHQGAGTVTNAVGIQSRPIVCSGGTCTNTMGIYVSPQTGGSTNYQIYSEGTSLSYFAGPMTITSKLNVAGTAPTISGSCGTSPSIVGSSVAGKLTTGTVAPTSCTLTFATAWTNAPACMATNETTANLARAVSTTTTVVLSGTFVASDVLSYVCIGRN